MSWREVASGVFVKPFGSDAVNVCAIVGPMGVTVVDTGSSLAEAHRIVKDLTTRFSVPIVGAINTHAHYDHSFGNCVFAALGIPIIGHHRIPAHYDAFEGPRLAAWQADPAREPDKDWETVVLTPPSVLIEERTTLTSIGREIQCLPIARGHTDTDLAVFVPDVRVWMFGDVIEESAPPMFGSGSFPLDWPAALEELLRRVQATDVIIPGHGSVVDYGFATRQATEIAAVSEAIRNAWTAGMSVEDTLATVRLRWPESMLRSAIAQGFSRLSVG